MEQWTYPHLKEVDYVRMNAELAHKDTIEVLKWAYARYGDDLVYACSFGAEGVVLIDLISKVRKQAKIIFLDTHLHFQETYELIDRIRTRYPLLDIELLEPELTLNQQKEQFGDLLWEKDPDKCCHLRKIVPLEKALTGAKAWISGLRREQSLTRAKTQFVNQDHRFQSVKICPLIYWTWDEIWTYIKGFDLTYNVLHDQGYPSIGCEKCTLPVEGEGDSRAGRWAKRGKTECGLHTT